MKNRENQACFEDIKLNHNENHNEMAEESTEVMTDEKWQAIVQNDASFDAQFIYAIKTTGIFCKPSCKSRIPKKENVRIFQNTDQALSEGFRPCKRCKPTGERLPDHEWVNLITHYIDHHYFESLTLQTLAESCHGSRFHLHRTFRRITGMTPVQYIQQIRMKKAKEHLLNTDDEIVDIALSVGMPSVSYFITLFKKMTGLTPNEYRRQKKTQRKHREVQPDESEK